MKYKTVQSLIKPTRSIYVCNIEVKKLILTKLIHQKQKKKQKMWAYYFMFHKICDILNIKLSYSVRQFHIKVFFLKKLKNHINLFFPYSLHYVSHTFVESYKTIIEITETTVNREIF